MMSLRQSPETNGGGGNGHTPKTDPSGQGAPQWDEVFSTEEEISEKEKQATQASSGDERSFDFSNSPADLAKKFGVEIKDIVNLRKGPFGPKISKDPTEENRTFIVEVVRLAKLTPDLYNQQRKEAAKKLKLRLPELDKEIKRFRNWANKSGGAKAPIGGRTSLGVTAKKIVTFQSLNKRFAVLQVPNAASIYVSRSDLYPTTSDDLKRRLENEVVLSGVDKDGNPIYLPAFATWKGHADRHVYGKVEFTGQSRPYDVFNLYKGLGVIPAEGDCHLILNHIEEVICSGDKEAFESMLKLLAWQIQNIGEPSRIVVILKSEKQQSGKGIFLENVMTKIYGPSGFQPSTIDQILGRFNDAVRGRAFIFLDEVLFAGDRKAADAVKHLSTATEGGIETKGLPIVTCPIAVNLWLSSNHKDAAYIEKFDARYWVLNVGEHRIADKEYFTALLNEIEGGGREAFAHHLLNLDVKDFKPQYDIKIDSSAKQEMIQHSVNAYDARKWIEACCHTERLIGLPLIAHQGNEYDWELERWVEWVEGAAYTFAQLNDAYVTWQKSVKSPRAPEPTPAGSLGELLGDCGFEEKSVRRSRGRILPSVDTCLEKVKLARGGHPATKGKNRGV